MWYFIQNPSITRAQRTILRPKETCLFRSRHHNRPSSSSTIITHASADSTKLMIAAQTKYDAGDRLAALRLWEKALRSDPDQDERLAALFNSTAVYASTGDLELARMSLREAVQLGLDYNATCQGNGDPRCVEMRASQQMLIQLRKFNEAVLKAMASKTATPSPPPGMRSSMKKNTSDSYIRRSSSSNSKKLRDNADDLTNILETDMEGLDTSILGVVKRVTLVLLALSVLGVGLFFYGLKYLTPPE